MIPIITKLARRVRALGRRSDLEREMDDEMRFHVEMEASELMRERGLSADEAWRQAMLSFGGVERHKFEGRRARGVQWAVDFVDDVRYGVRGLLRNPGWSAVAVLTLALGIGANTAIFSITNWSLLRPLPAVADPDRLVLVEMRDPNDQGTGFSLPNLNDLGASVPAFDAMAGIAAMEVQVAARGASPLVAEAQIVTGDFFRVLGLEPERGRFFALREVAATSPDPVVVISDVLWRSLFERDPGAVGATVRVNGSDFTVVGVAPAGFQGTERLERTDIWFPPAAYPVLAHAASMDIGDRSLTAFMSVIGRLGTRATPQLAQAQLRAGMQGLNRAYPAENEIYIEDRMHPTVFTEVGAPVRAVERMRSTSLLLSGLVGVVLIIACANVSNLLLFRAVRRRGEMAMRRAIGASTWRLLRQSLAEGMVLALTGAVLALLVAVVLIVIIGRTELPSLPPLAGIVAEPGVLGFTGLVALVTGLIFGVTPVLWSGRSDVQSHLRETTGRSSMRGGRTRAVLTVAQLAGSVALVTGALLLTRSISNLSRLEIGFDPTDLTVFVLDPGDQGYDAEAVNLFRTRLLDEVSRIPGVRSASLSTGTPFAGKRVLRFQARPGKEVEQVEPWAFFTSENFFGTLGLPLIAGRDIRREEWTGATGDDGAPLVISRSLAEKLYGSVAAAVGRPIWQDGYREQTQHMVVGVVEDARTVSLREPAAPAAYAPLGKVWGWQTRTTILLRSSRPQRDLEQEVREVVARIDPDVPLAEIATVQQGIRRTIAEERQLGTMLRLFAALATALAAVGLYGVVAYSVTLRTRELGIRIALGAPRRLITRLVINQSLALSAIGVVLGLAGGVVIGRAVRSRLFGVEPLDPASYVIAAAVFAAVALVAAAAPARAAARVDPVRTLNAE